jgi:glycosyltransferase involved in cell wall biosynthesis
VLKIAHIDTGRTLGGGQRQLLRLARELRRRGHRQWIASPDGSALAAEARKEGFSVFVLPRSAWGGARWTLRLRHLFLAEGFDILHAHDGRGQTLTALASAGADCRRVASRRVTFLPRWRMIHRLQYQYTCDRVIAVSKYIKGLLVECGVPEAMIDVIYDGIEIPAAPPGKEERSRARARWGLGRNDFVAGNLGPLRKEKGHQTAFEAARWLAAQRPELKWLFAVSGEPEENRAEASNFLERANNIRMIAAPEHLEDFFAALDLYVMPSLAEGLGSSVLLAMARGLPVVASRAGGLPEIVQEGATGWLFTPGSARELADRVARALENPQELRRLSANAMAKAREFSDGTMAARTEALYLKLQPRHTGPPPLGGSP